MKNDDAKLSNQDKRAIKKLQDELALYDMNIEDYPEDANPYYMKAGALVKLAKYAENSTTYLTQALENYNKAIELEPENPLYLVDRGKLYMEANEPSLALADITEVKKLGETKDIVGIYVKNTLNDIEQELNHLNINSTEYEGNSKENLIKTLGSGED